MREDQREMTRGNVTTGLMPIVRMWSRADIAREDSDTAYFDALLYLGEMLTKLVACGLVAAVNEDVDRNRYRLLHRLVRANSIGGWSQVIDEVVNGHTSNHLLPGVRIEQRELLQKRKAGTWQHDSVAKLRQCLIQIGASDEAVPGSMPGRRWFSEFAHLRNKARHGAIPSHLHGSLCQPLEESLKLITGNFNLFRRSWAYLHLNLSGRYRVTKLTQDASLFEPLKSGPSQYLPGGDGVYIYIGQPLYVDLIESDADATDFFFANGGFTSHHYELLSYITGKTKHNSSAPYMAPATSLPESVTQGEKLLEIHESVYANLPSEPTNYVNRPELEAELTEKLTDARNPVVTLLGRGGIGKTSSSIFVLHELSKRNEFEALFWFSARDIDLLEEGPKYVKPEILTEKDIARVFTDLMRSIEDLAEDIEPLSYLREALGGGTKGGPYLFVFDNFETVDNPVELFEWVNQYIRLPNKILITTRFRQFKGDYPVEVSGMSYQETKKLIDSEARRLRVSPLLNDKYRQELYDKSDGHPYVVKILLGEVAAQRRLVPPGSVVETKERILEALFERTFERLSPAAKRVFLILCSWRSIVPLVALEAVMLHRSDEGIDVGPAIEELSQSSFVEILSADSDDQLFVTVPLAAVPYGRRQVDVLLLKNKIQTELRLLRAFGVTKSVDVHEGLKPRVKNFFRYLDQNPDEVEDCLPIVKHIARRYSPAWEDIIYLYEKTESRPFIGAKDATRQYLLSTDSEADRLWGWRKLANLCGRTGDLSGEINALLEMCQLRDVPFKDISYTAGRFLPLFRNHDPLNYTEKQTVISQLVRIMESRVTEAHPDDLGRLAWLCLHVKDAERARGFVQLGLSQDPRNRHLIGLAKTLKVR